MNAATDSQELSTLGKFLFGEDGNTLGAWAKLLAIVGSCLYGLGTIIANEYLGNLSAKEFAWPAPQAVLTGVWAVFIIFFSSTPTAIAGLVVTVGGANRRSWALATAVFFGAVVFSSFGMTILLRIIFLVDLHEVYEIGPIPISKPVVHSIVMFAFVGMLSHLVSFWVEEDDQVQLLAGMALLGSLAVTIFELPVIYSEIPTARGGGQPENVVVVLGKSGANSLALLCGTPNPPDTALSGRALLLFEGSTEYILGFSGSKLVGDKSERVALKERLRESREFVLAGAEAHGFQLVRIPKTAIDAIWFLDYPQGKRLQKVGLNSCALKFDRAATDYGLKKIESDRFVDN